MSGILLFTARLYTARQQHAFTFDKEAQVNRGGATGFRQAGVPMMQAGVPVVQMGARCSWAPAGDVAERVPVLILRYVKSSVAGLAGFELSNYELYSTML